MHQTAALSTLAAPALTITRLNRLWHMGRSEYWTPATEHARLAHVAKYAAAWAAQGWPMPQ